MQYKKSSFTIYDDLRIEVLDRLISIKHSIILNNIFTHVDYIKLINNLIENFNINDTLDIIYMILDDITLGDYPGNYFKIYSSEIENIITKIDSTYL